MTADGAPPVSAFVVKAGETKKITARRLGNLAGTFLMIANQSAVNGGGYNITVTGLPKEKKVKMKVVKKEEEKEQTKKEKEAS